MAGRGELGHVEADLGDDDVRGVQADAGEIVEPLDDRERDAARVGGAAAAAAWSGVEGGWVRGRSAISWSMRSVSVSVFAVGASIWSSSIWASSAWCSSKRPVELDKRGVLLAHLPARERGEDAQGHARPR